MMNELVCKSCRVWWCYRSERWACGMVIRDSLVGPRTCLQPVCHKTGLCSATWASTSLKYLLSKHPTELPLVGMPGSARHRGHLCATELASRALNWRAVKFH